MDIGSLIYSKLQDDLLETEVNSLKSYSVCLGTSLGNVRSQNEDRTVFCVLKSDISIYPIFISLLCDGMGGMKGGSLAASLTISSFLENFITLKDPEQLIECFSQSINYANKKVYHELGGRGGTTLSVLISHEDHCFIANVGDSRIYRASKGAGLTQLTIDDDVSQLLKEQGLFVDNELLNRNGITKFIGMDDDLHFEITKVLSDESYLLLTDGAYRIGQKLLAVLFENSHSNEVFVERVIQVADWMGGVDNSTCQIVDFRMIKGLFSGENIENSLMILEPSSISNYIFMKPEANKTGQRKSSRKKEKSPNSDSHKSEADISQESRVNLLDEFEFNVIDRDEKEL